MEGRVVQVADVLSDPEYTYVEPALRAGYRTFLAVPMMRDGNAIGVLVVARRRVRAVYGASRSTWSQPSPTRR